MRLRLKAFLFLQSRFYQFHLFYKKEPPLLLLKVLHLLYLKQSLRIFEQLFVFTVLLIAKLVGEPKVVALPFSCCGISAIPIRHLFCHHQCLLIKSPCTSYPCTSSPLLNFQIVIDTLLLLILLFQNPFVIDLLHSQCAIIISFHIIVFWFNQIGIVLSSSNRLNG